MEFAQYLQLSERTAANPEKYRRSDRSLTLLNGAAGLSAEAGEILHSIHKHVVVGKELDVANIKEELGDLMWYVGQIVRELKFDFGDILQKNVDKLDYRHDGKPYEVVSKKNKEEELKLFYQEA